MDDCYEIISSPSKKVTRLITQKNTRKKGMRGNIPVFCNVSQTKRDHVTRMVRQNMGNNTGRVNGRRPRLKTPLRRGRRRALFSLF